MFSTFSPEDCRPLTWYEKEGRYDLIMLGVEHGGPTYLEHYEAELIQRYPERCLAVLVKAADDSVEHGKKRSDYRYIVKYLKWMWKYPGGKEKAAILADSYRKRYPRRSAMIGFLKDEDGQFVTEGGLDVEKILKKFVEHFTESFGNSADAFVEENGK